MQQSNDSKIAINKRIKYICNKKSKTIAVWITSKNKYVVVETITSFVNAQWAHNEAGKNSGSSHMKVGNIGANKQA